MKNLVLLLTSCFIITSTWAQTNNSSDDGQKEAFRGISCSFSSNYTEAVEWYKKSAAKGNSLGIWNLGLAYRDGKGVAQNYSKALKCFFKGADDNNSSSSQNEIGNFYYNGLGVAQDYIEAIKWYRKSAEQGFANAQTNLGICYEKGHGVQQNYSEAMKWYTKAAEQKYDKAKTQLANLKQKFIAETASVSSSSISTNTTTDTRSIPVRPPYMREPTMIEKMKLSGHIDSPYWDKYQNATTESQRMVALKMAIIDNDSRAMVAAGDYLFAKVDNAQYRMRYGMVNPYEIASLSSELFMWIAEAGDLYVKASMLGNDEGYQRLVQRNDAGRVQMQYMQQQQQLRQEISRIDNELYEKQMRERERDRNFQNARHENTMANQYERSANEAYDAHKRAAANGNSSQAQSEYSKYRQNLEQANQYLKQKYDSEQQYQNARK